MSETSKLEEGIRGFMAKLGFDEGECDDMINSIKNLYHLYYINTPVKEEPEKPDQADADDFYGSEDPIVYMVDMPGVAKEKVDIDYNRESRTITVAGERNGNRKVTPPYLIFLKSARKPQKQLCKMVC